MKIICKILYFIAALLFAAFVISFGIDAYKYITGVYFGSAPLYAYALIRAVEFIFPCIIVFIIAKICKKKFVKK